MRPAANAALTARSSRRDRTVVVLETGSQPAVRHLDTEELEAGLDEILRSPSVEGAVLLIARRPAEGEREVLEEATLDLAAGLVGDNWSARGSSRTPDGS